LRIKEQETRLNLQEHYDDDDDIFIEVMWVFRGSFLLCKTEDMSRLARSPVNEVAACNSATIRKKCFS
jgi:hypothetical protein